MENSITCLVDMDDTLIPCNGNYTLREFRFAEYVHERIGDAAGTVPDLVALASATNGKLIAERGVAMEVFPTALLTAYETVCQRLKRPTSTDEIAHIKDIGWSVFLPENYLNILFPGVREALTFLRDEKKCELILNSQGDKKLQTMKIELNGIAHYFSHQNIVPSKTDEAFQRVVGARDKSRVISIGDSVTYDINPATRTGTRGIHIDPGMRSDGYEHPHLVFKMERFADIPQSYDDIIHRWDEISVLGQRR